MPSNNINDLDAPASRLAVTLTADRIFGKVLTLRECADILRSFRVETAVAILCSLKHINERIYLNPETSRSEWELRIANFIHDFFDESHRAKVLQDVKDNIDCFYPLSDQAILATLELALSVCPRNSGSTFEATESLPSIAFILLSFQSRLLSTSLQTRADEIKSWREVTDLEFAEFIRNYLAHNTIKNYGHCLARFYAFCCLPEINLSASLRLARPFDEWFKELFGVTPKNYFRLACLLIMPAYRLDLKKPTASDLYFIPEQVYKSVREPEFREVVELMKFATLSLEDFSDELDLDLSLTEFMYDSVRFNLQPILKIGDFSICVSPSLLMGKFIIGLPYLATEARKRSLGRELNGSEAKAVRGPLGYIFESYVVFLLQQWLKDWTNTEIIPSYKTQLGERDLAVIRGDTAFAFEIKLAAPTLDLRKFGIFDYLDKMVLSGAKQVRLAAQSLISGDAFRKDGTQILGVRRVIPCVITYDKIPLSAINSSAYEKHLEEKIGQNVFCEANGIYPLQFFDAEFLESWEGKFDLSPNSGGPFGYLEQRARDTRLRYLEAIESEIKLPPRPESPKPFDALVDTAKNHSIAEGSMLLVK